MLPLRQRVTICEIPVSEARYTLENHHYLKRARVGRQINYAIYVDNIFDGVITYAYPMMSAPLLGVPSDELIEFARLFLYTNTPHTATCAIGKSLKRIKQDWMKRFPNAKEPKLVVSWSDSEIHEGTIYKAANFRWIKRTKGDKRKAPRNQANTKRGYRLNTTDYHHAKDCWIYPLDKFEIP